jgi:hypothetical protein
VALAFLEGSLAPPRGLVLFAASSLFAEKPMRRCPDRLKVIRLSLIAQKIAQSLLQIPSQIPSRFDFRPLLQRMV